MPAPGASLLPGSSLLPSASLHVHSVILSAVAGYVDAAGFASLIGLFPAHLTGELVVDAVAFSSGNRQGHAIHLWVLPVFVSSVVAATFVARVLRRRGRRPLTGLLMLVTLALSLFSASDWIVRLLHETGQLAMFMHGGCAVAAMGFQNALMRESLQTSCPTTVMTGNLTQVVIDLADRAFNKIFQPSPLDRRPKSRLGLVSAALAAFVGCAVLGGWLTRIWGSLGVVLPTLFTAVLTVRAWREEHARVAPNPISQVGSPRVPSFEPMQSSPELLMSHAPAGPVSGTQIRSAQALPPAPDTLSTAATRAPAEKRTISGTRLAQRLPRDEE
jgi:uncharacterized membrane protein YoaK (UPF0700 family)